jgi:ABC-2 type transport system permease protein
MKGSVVRTLILSDWNRHRFFILLSIVGGIFAVGLVEIGGELPAVLGSTWFFVSLVVLGSMLPVSNVINERKKQTLAFLMSLPISVAQYTTAKIVSTMGMFLLPWLSLVVAGVSLIASRQGLPDGMIPALLILAGFTLVGFCVIAGVAMATESEAWTIVATIALNSSYGFWWYVLIRNGALRTDFASAVPVWSPTVVTILLGEATAIAVILALMFYLQSRKRDFVY